MRQLSASYHTSVELRGGQSLHLRPIRPEDRLILRSEFHRLSPDSVRNRFFNAKQCLTEAELDYLTEVDFIDHVALMAEVESDACRYPVAVGRFVRDGDDPDRAEFAITVVDAWQGRGVGKTLLLHLIACARELGVRHFVGLLFAENRRMLRLLHSIGLPLEMSSDAGIDTISLRL